MPARERRVRPAEPRDLQRIAEIYNQGIDSRLATFETRHRSPGDVASWLGTRYPVTVVEEGPTVEAFASTSQYRPRECYAGIAEFSVYVDQAKRKSGLGTVAMLGLIRAAREARLWKLVSRVFVSNLASRHLLAKLGFREVGIYEKHAQLDAVWHDVVIVELILEK
jgi:L-amino acid N-acyltransferase YncA